MRNPILTLLGGNFKQSKKKPQWSHEAQSLLESAFRGLDQVYDYHLHLLGLGNDNEDTWINPDILSMAHPIEYAKAKVFMNASGIRNKEKAERQYLDQLFRLVEGFPPRSKFCVFALDKCYEINGEVNLEDSRLYVSNEYVHRVCQRLPERLVPVASIHPYRKDALEQLEWCASKGIKMVKWLPATMGMDPSEPRCVPFYLRMKELDMVLLSHAGEEEAVPVEKFQPLNNPLLFRLPLEVGIKVILAHCAGKGKGEDFDYKGKMVYNYNLFFRMMDNPRYEGKLFGDVSALAQSNRCGGPLKTVFERKEHHHRLLYGSDYPLPAVNSAISLKILVKLGYLDAQEKAPLQEIYNQNPLLFSFVLFRRLRDPQNPHYRFPDSLFTYHHELGI